MTTRHYVVGSIGLALLAYLAYATFRAGQQVGEFPLWGIHAVLAPLAMLIAPAAIVIGTLLMTSQEAIEDNERRKASGRVHPGPLASKGIALVVLGSLMAIYPFAMVKIAPQMNPSIPTKSPTNAPLAEMPE